MNQTTSLGRRCLSSALLGLTLAALLAASAVAQALGTVYSGKSMRIGRGIAHTIVRTDSHGKVVAAGVEFTQGALSGLPRGTDKRSNFEYFLAMPTRGPHSVFDHVMLDWESLGHPPPHVYDVPHFDFHFYVVSRAAQASVRFRSKADSGSSRQQPPASLMPMGYIMAPGTAISGMGAHAVNPAAPEFHGQPFTSTFLYGYYDRHLIFLEPMVSIAFLRSRPDSTWPVIRPAAYGIPGAYPSTYSVKYDAARKTYVVTLQGLEPAVRIVAR